MASPVLPVLVPVSRIIAGCGTNPGLDWSWFRKRVPVMMSDEGKGEG